MSEAMTNREIEDVLSSVRRLVAQESRPASVQFPVGAGPRPAQGTEQAAQIAAQVVPPAAATAVPSSPAEARSIAGQGGGDPVLGRLQHMVRRREALVLLPEQRIGLVPAPEQLPAAPAQPARDIAQRLADVSGDIARLALAPAGPDAGSAPFPFADKGRPLGPPVAVTDALPGLRAATSSYFRPATHGQRPRIDLDQLEAEITALEREIPNQAEAAAAAGLAGVSAEPAGEMDAGFAAGPDRGGRERIAPSNGAATAEPSETILLPRRFDAEIVENDVEFIDEDNLRAIVAGMVRELLRDEIGRGIRAELQGEIGQKMTLQIRRLVRGELERLRDERPDWP